MLMAGLDWTVMEAEDLMNVFYSALIDDPVSMGVARQEVRQEVDKKLAEALLIYQAQKLAYYKQREEAGQPLDVAKPEPAPFVLTPQMQAAFGLKPRAKAIEGGD